MQSFSKVVCDRPNLHPAGEEEMSVSIVVSQTKQQRDKESPFK